MKRYRGKQVVDPGVYFNGRRVCFRTVDEKGPLPGGTSDVYRRVPALALLVAAPLLGLVYVLFLPFIGVAMVTWLIVRTIARAIAGTTRTAAEQVSSKPLYVVPIGPVDHARRRPRPGRRERGERPPTGRAA